MKKLKKKTLLKNPNFSEGVIDELSGALIHGNINLFSHALVRYFSGKECTDCGKYYQDCTCEGDTEIQGPCRDCGVNYCLCNYKIDKNSPKEKVRFAILKWIKKNLNDRQIFIIKRQIKFNLGLVQPVFRNLTIDEIIAHLNDN